MKKIAYLTHAALDSELKTLFYKVSTFENFKRYQVTDKWMKIELTDGNEIVLNAERVVELEVIEVIDE